MLPAGSGELMSGKLTRAFTVAFAILLLSASAAQAGSGLGPAEAEKTLAGAPLAVRHVESKLQNGENIEIDETKAATALKRQADAGDVASMQVLAPMMIRGRGTAQDPEGGIALLIKAAGHSKDGAVEYQIGGLHHLGTNGLEPNVGEAMSGIRSPRAATTTGR
jgi:TPR repeat protein